MRIQPIDSIRGDFAKAPVLKSRLKRLFDRPFNGVLKISSAVAGGEKDGCSTAAVAEFEPTSVCLDKMVQNFIEDNNEKQSTTTVGAAKYGRNRCNCFNGNSNDSSDDEFDFFSDSVSANSSFSDPSDTLKSLIPCASVVERNLLADTSKIVEKNNKTCKRKDDLRRIVTDALLALGYNSSLCKSKWEKSSSVPAGEYEYIDVIIAGERILIDVDFRSEFEIARSTSSYKAILQSLPYIFVGKSDRLLQIVSVASEAARQSLKKKGMHIAPWRKSEYMKSKWLSPHTRITQPKPPQNDAVLAARPEPEPEPAPIPETRDDLDYEFEGELDLIFCDSTTLSEETNSPPAPALTWQMPAVRQKSLELGNKAVVTGLASLLREKL
ncbi:uncharacterized protein LOC127249324 [Andrographis paniculata]|uniref:uncharacterized protein LOC127249324 n=1 Tax=Andrographis paniculata TaxID=175694 RepID=UPI0021E7C16B|nr:uncharacterized protein LOC127249324 [Andrographis paniculata]